MTRNLITVFGFCGLVFVAACGKEKGAAIYPAGIVPTGSETQTLVKTEEAAPYKMEYVDIFQEWSRVHKYQLKTPKFDLNPQQVTEAGQSALKEASNAVAKLSAKDGNGLSFEESFGELDEIYYDLVSVWSPLYLMKETSPSAPIREAASEQSVLIEQWLVGLYADPQLYRVLKDASENFSNLNPEQSKFVEDTLQEFERAGLALAPDALKKVTDLKKSHASLQEDFQVNINSAKAVVIFEEDQLEGVPADFLDQKKNKDGKIQVDMTVTNDFLMISENAIREESRRIANEARYSIAQDKNTEVLQKLLEIRDQIAEQLGYRSWADYRTEPRMARSQAAVEDRLMQMVAAFEPKFESELAEMKALKEADRAQRPEVVESEGFHIWDYSYYQSQLKKTKYSVDTSELRNYFPMEKVKAAVFSTFGELFDLEFIQLDAPYKWVDDLEFYVVLDASSKAPLGLFYLDLYPRENKYKHFAHFDILPAKKMQNGVFQRPVSALVCNFPKPTAERPSLLDHDNVETFFHEFGHLIHAMVSQAELASFAGTNVERDFVEAPSQMFEAWAWDYSVLSKFARHYEKPEEVLSEEMLENMKKAKLGTIGFWYRRQLTFGLMDMRFHGEAASKDVVEITNQAFDEIFLSAPEGTNFSANFGHMAGYDGGYYGYAWADAIAQDLLSAFENAPNGLMDKEVGMRLRREIYAVGGARPASESIEAFLQRPYDLEAFRRNYGLVEAGTED